MPVHGDVRPAPSDRFAAAYSARRPKSRYHDQRGHSTSSSISSIASVAEYDSEENEPHPAEFELDAPHLQTNHQRNASDGSSPAVKYKPLLLKPSSTSRPAPWASQNDSDSDRATADSLLAYLYTLRKQPPLSRTQSETVTGMPLNKALRHQRQSSTDSNSSATSDEGTKPAPLDWSTIDMTHKRISELPLEVIQILQGHVTRLALGYNHLTGLPPEFAALGSTLRYINVRVNSLTVFPSVVRRFPDQITLYSYQGCLQLTQMPSLEILDISRNKITRFPRQPGTLCNLKVFSVSKNRITRLPAYVATLTELRVFKIDHNPIEYPPRDVIAYPGNSSPTAAHMQRTQSDRSYDIDKDKDDQQTMQRWLAGLQRYLRLNPDRKSSATEISDGEQSDDETRVDRRRRPKSPDVAPPSTQPLAAPPPRHHFQPTDRKHSDPHVPSTHMRKGSVVPLNRHREGLRTKKSLPDLKLGQSPVSSSSPTPTALRSPTEIPSNLRFAPVSPSSQVGGGDMKHLDRQSGAYFRRLSMLPPNQTMPPHLMQFIDSVRGILFALSQSYTSLKQFVAFATQDRLPAALTKMMSSADESMGSLINALDRFDSSSRRRIVTTDVRDVLEACRDSVSVFAKLIGVLRIQLKALTSQADTRYIRTLQLMLYGSLGEIGIAWKAMGPLALEMAQLIARDVGGAATMLVQPPTPSSKKESMPVPMHSDSKLSSMAKPVATTAPSFRRHGGSFSTQDVQAGATMKPASLSDSASDQPAPSLPRTRNIPRLPIPPSLPAGSGLQALLDTLEGQPPTPIFQHPPSTLPMPPSSRLPVQAEAPAPSSGRLPMPPPRRQGTGYSTPSGAAPPQSARPAIDSAVDKNYLDLVDHTTNLTFSVLNLLSEHLSLVQPSPRVNELSDLCGSTNDLTRKLRNSLDTFQHDPSSLLSKQQVIDDSGAFIRSLVSVIVKAKSSKQELQLGNQVKDGLSQLAKSGHSLVAMQSVTTFRDKP